MRPALGLPFLAAALLTAGLLLAACSPRAQVPTGGAEAVAADSLAARILDETRSAEERRNLVAAHPDRAVPLLQALVRDLPPGTEEEYRRIPWIWRVTVAAGERNDAAEIRRVLEVSLPKAEEPLLDWQAVVIGGGIINGIGRVGGWPAERVAEILAGRSDLSARWRRALELSAAMADDPEVPDPTRYDALRMIAMETWDRRGAQLVRYLQPGVSEELQMGAIDGLADMRSPQATEALLAHLAHYSERNRGRALNALLRDEARMSALLDAVAAGQVTAAELGAERVEQLRSVDNAALQARARQLFRD